LETELLTRGAGVATDEGIRSNRERGSSQGLRKPTRNEQQVALVLLEKLIVSDAARGQLEQISLGQPVRQKAFDLMQRLADAYVKQRLS
jgi:hypothetical protein